MLGQSTTLIQQMIKQEVSYIIEKHFSVITDIFVKGNSFSNVNPQPFYAPCDTHHVFYFTFSVLLPQKLPVCFLSIVHLYSFLLLINP